MLFIINIFKETMLNKFRRYSYNYLKKEIVDIDLILT
jgi:hypothetical protein